ncbi:DUF4349 domain-containing protein [Nocardia testacea]|uniref:DUF4349 domain-containing protein n=1 Tax=Nocardia testacea TaxID=248551 RepID=UPI0033D0D937
MRKLGVLVAVVCGSVLLAGCGDESSSGTADHTMSFEGEAPAPATAPGIRVQKAPAREQAPAPAPDTDDQATARKEVVTGTVDLTADDPVAAAQTLVDRVAELDGRVDQRTENPGTADDDPHANLVVRIPATDTDAFIEGMGDLGEITQISTNRDDVTLQWQDLDARITALRASVDRLRDLMTRAANTADLIAAEEALADRQAELDSLTGQRRYLDDQISLSTLTVDIQSTAEKTGADGPTNFWDGVVDGWNSLFDWLKDAVVFIGRALPWLAFLALLGAIVGALVGLARRLGTARAAAPAAGNSAARVENPAPGISRTAAEPGDAPRQDTKDADKSATDTGRAAQGTDPTATGAGETAPSPGRTATDRDETAPGTGRAVPGTDPTATGAGETAPGPGRAVTGADEAAPDAGGVVPGADEAAPDAGRVVPGADESRSTEKKAVDPDGPDTDRT